MHNQWHPYLPIMIENKKLGAHITDQQYMSIWRTHNNIIEKWVDEKHLLNKDNLMCEHNLTVIHKTITTLA